MFQAPSTGRKSLSLSVRISLWLIGVAILPLLVALVISELQSRPTLVNQANTTMETDAKTHAQLIDSYLSVKLLTLQSLDYTPLVLGYFLDPAGAQAKANAHLIIENGMAINKKLDPEILLVTFFTPQGKQLLFYSPVNLKPQPHGKDLIPPGDLQRIALGHQFISGVYYDPTTHQSTVELYTPIYSTTLKRVLGVVRDTMSLAVITSIVHGENGANGSGSYAFILDQNGVRIIDPHPKVLFTSIAPLSPLAQQQVQEQNLYGSSGTLPVLADTTLQGIQSQQKPETSFTDTPADANEPFQVTRLPLTSVPWTYFVLTPVNVVLALANQQLLILSLLALFVIIPVAVIGWIVGNRISSPILRSVGSLVGNSAVLNELSGKEENAASEQIWVVDASVVGLNSVEYYTEASKKAIWRLNDLGREMLLRRNGDMQSSFHDIEVMVNIGQYLEKAIAYQDDSNRKVAVAIKVTNEVAAQLAAGAKASKAVAKELEQVVKQLRHIVGK